MALKVDPSVNPLAARERSNAPSATDFRQFAALRRGAQANDPNALREVARQFESIFTKMMLDSMRSASFGDPMFGSDQGDMYQGMMDDGAAVPTKDEAGAAGSASPEQQSRFIDAVMPHATAAARELGVDARAIVAQAALETGWGTSKPADAGGNSHNFFGIKAGANWQGASVAADTTEYVAGEAGTERARFRAYGSLAENVRDYVHVIRDNPRYSAALGTGTDVRAFANALQRGGYATDPEYANKLVATFEKVAARQSIAADATADVKRFKSADATPIPPQELSNG